MGHRTHATFARFGRRPSAAEALERPRVWYRRHRRLRILFFVTVALVALFAAMANVAEDRRKLEEGSWIRSGALNSADLQFDDSSGYFDLWLVDLAEGQTLRVEMRSEEIGVGLYVQGPLSDPEPEIVAEGMSAGDGGVVRAEFSAVSAGEYSVVVPSDSQSGFGTYELTSNYRLAELDLWADDELEGGAEVLLMLLVILWLAQIAGVPAFLFWRHPDRILLLRPFGERRISRSLKKFNRKTLAYRGFTFTLADKHLKNSMTAFLLAHVPVDLGSLVTVLYRPLFRRIHRYVMVRKPGDLRLVQLRLRSRWRLGALWQSWLGIGDRINKFRSRNELWQDCVGILLDNCQVIVTDVSQAGEGTAWEIEEIFGRGYAYRAVFMVRDDEDEVAAACRLLGRIAAKMRVAEEDVPTLHCYSTADGSLSDEEAFEEAYAGAVSSGRQPEVTALPISIKAMFALIPTLVLGPFWLPVGLTLAVLALRDIRRADGMLGGEVAANLAILINGAILGLITLVAVFVAFAE